MVGGHDTADGRGSTGYGGEDRTTAARGWRMTVVSYHGSERKIVRWFLDMMLKISVLMKRLQAFSLVQSNDLVGAERRKRRMI
ncbi:unnamed protein product [Urochloa humidicola]